MNMCTLSCSTSFLALVTASVGLGLVVLDDELHVHAAELAAVLVEIHLEAVDHVLADLGKDAGHRRDETDAQIVGLRMR